MSNIWHQSAEPAATVEATVVFLGLNAFSFFPNFVMSYELQSTIRQLSQTWL
jgi:hypothetical protein